MSKKKYIITGSLLAASILISTPALAATIHSSVGTHIRVPITKNLPNSIVGTVASISGNSITVTGRNTTTVYTVDISNAKISKSGSEITVSGIAVGDTVMVHGTVSGTTVTATTVMDGLPPHTAAHATQARGSFTIGTVSAVSGSSFTLTSRERAHATSTAESATFTVATDASTTFKKGGQASSLSDIAAGQYVVVSGPLATSTDSIAATSVNILTGTSTRSFLHPKAKPASSTQ